MWEQRTERIREQFENTRSVQGSIMGPHATNEARSVPPAEHGAITDFGVKATIHQAADRNRFGALDLWVQKRPRPGEQDPTAGAGDGVPADPTSRTNNAVQAARIRARRRSYFDSSYSATAVPPEQGGVSQGVELVRLSMGDFVEALSADKRRTQHVVLKFLQRVGYFQTWTTSRLLVLAGLLEQRRISAGDFVFKQVGRVWTTPCGSFACALARR